MRTLQEVPFLFVIPRVNLLGAGLRENRSPIEIDCERSETIYPIGVLKLLSFDSPWDHAHKTASTNCGCRFVVFYGALNNGINRMGWSSVNMQLDIGKLKDEYFLTFLWKSLYSIYL